MGFYTEDVFILLLMDGLVATLTMRTPLLYTHTYIHMYDKENWYPNEEKFNIFEFAIKLITSIPKLIEEMINRVKILYLKNKWHHKCTLDSFA